MSLYPSNYYLLNRIFFLFIVYCLLFFLYLVYNTYKSKKYFFICLKGAIFIIFTNNCLLYILLILFL